jgi:hypothetical protein
MIFKNVQQLREEIPAGVTVVAAVKTRSPEEISQAIAAGIRVVGENYVQETLQAHQAVKDAVQWHFIGHLQTNKVRKIVDICDMIQTVDSLHLAREIDKRSALIGKMMPVLIEINSGREPQKTGVMPESARDLVWKISGLSNLSIQGLMTMGPLAGDPEEARPFFVETRRIFEELKGEKIPKVEMKFLSMGMTNSYRVAIQEGSTMVRIGTRIFGPRSS